MRDSLKKILMTVFLAGVMLYIAGCEGKEEIRVNSNGITVIDLTKTGANNEEQMFVDAQNQEAIDEQINVPETEDDAIADDSPEDTVEGEGADEADAEDSGKESEDGEAGSDGTSDETVVTPGSVEKVSLNPSWTYAGNSKINSGSAVLYRAADNRKNIVIGVNAGHGTKGGQSVKTFCHPDQSPKVTGGSTAAGSIEAAAVSGGMSFNNGSSEASVTLRTAQLLRDKLLAAGYDVLMLRDDSDVQLDNVARTVIASNTANGHIAIHFDGDGLSYDKGCFYCSVPDGIKGMEPVASHWKKHEALGDCLIAGLREAGCKINGAGKMAVDLTQTSYSTVASVDIELGNQASSTDDASLSKLADGLLLGIKKYFP